MAFDCSPDILSGNLSSCKLSKETFFSRVRKNLRIFLVPDIVYILQVKAQFFWVCWRRWWHEPLTFKKVGIALFLRYHWVDLSSQIEFYIYNMHSAGGTVYVGSNSHSLRWKCMTIVYNLHIVGTYFSFKINLKGETSHKRPTSHCISSYLWNKLQRNRICV